MTLQAVTLFLCLAVCLWVGGNGDAGEFGVDVAERGDIGVNHGAIGGAFIAAKDYGGKLIGESVFKCFDVYLIAVLIDEMMAA